MSKEKLFKKTDLIIVFILVLIAAAGFFAFRVLNSGKGMTVRVLVDGKLYGVYELGESVDAGNNTSDPVDAVAGGYGTEKSAYTGNMEVTDNSGVKVTGNAQVIEIPGKIGTCILTIKDGKADMTFADCPNQICVHHEAIMNKGETIVCLPNRVVVEIGGAEDEK